MARIAEMAGRVGAFAARMAEVRRRTGLEGAGWYPYDSLGTIAQLPALFGDFELFDEIRGERVLDIGCADGDIAYFLESEGFEVVAIDNPRTNFNGLAGVRALKTALGSRLEIVPGDLDDDLFVPAGPFGVALVFGLLYHLKNPFRVLDMVSRVSRYCLLSTRVARRAPDGTALRDLPVGYLVGDAETNDDATNYWIFSEAGLRRVMERSGWRIVRYVSVGNTVDSEPVTAAGDERAFVLAERATGVDTNCRLGRGWHEASKWDRWQWVEREFEVLVRPGGGWVRAEVYYPEALHSRLGATEVRAEWDGGVLGTLAVDGAGGGSLRVAVPEGCSSVRFVCGKWLAPEGNEERELAMIVSAVRWGA